VLKTRSATVILAMICCVSACAPARSNSICKSSAEASRNLVLSFYTKALIEKQPRAAFAEFVSANFIEHKPDVPSGGGAAVADFLEGLIKELPGAKWEILRTVAEKNLVFLHARFTPAPGAPPYAIADIFRIEHCAIVEHWDVVGPPRDGQPNSNSRF
jgi:predicted SnoaL-like aldol condensation-catalyzing enzyme